MTATDTLLQKIDETQCPIVVGLDPTIDRIPEAIRDSAEKTHGNSLEGAAEAIFSFNRLLLDRLNGLIPAVKLQMACYELYGPPGLAVFQRTVDYARQLGLVVIDDSKRGDIGSTAALYAKGHLGQTPLFHGTDSSNRADFLTVNPLLGSDSIDPFVKECDLFERGLFILVRTSNASASQYQDARINGKPLYQQIAIDVQQLASARKGASRYASIGAVVGATWPEEMALLRELMPSVFFLVPGFGAQGATAEQVMPAFDQSGYGAVINSSRGIIFAVDNVKDSKGSPRPEEFANAAWDAVVRMRDELLRSLQQADKLPENW